MEDVYNRLELFEKTIGERGSFFGGKLIYSSVSLCYYSNGNQFIASFRISTRLIPFLEWEQRIDPRFPDWASWIENATHGSNTLLTHYNSSWRAIDCWEGRWWPIARNIILNHLSSLWQYTFPSIGQSPAPTFNMNEKLRNTVTVLRHGLDMHVQYFCRYT